MKEKDAKTVAALEKVKRSVDMWQYKYQLYLFLGLFVFVTAFLAVFGILEFRGDMWVFYLADLLYLFFIFFSIYRMIKLQQQATDFQWYETQLSDYHIIKNYRIWKAYFTFFIETEEGKTLSLKTRSVFPAWRSSQNYTKYCGQTVTVGYNPKNERVIVLSLKKEK